MLRKKKTYTVNINLHQKKYHDRYTLGYVTWWDICFYDAPKREVDWCSTWSPNRAPLYPEICSYLTEASSLVQEFPSQRPWLES